MPAAAIPEMLTTHLSAFVLRPGLAARVPVRSVQHVVQNSAPADRLAECTADWVVVFYLPCLGVDFLCNFTGDGGLRTRAPPAAGTD